MTTTVQPVVTTAAATTTTTTVQPLRPPPPPPLSPQVLLPRSTLTKTATGNLTATAAAPPPPPLPPPPPVPIITKTATSPTIIVIAASPPPRESRPALAPATITAPAPAKISTSGGSPKRTLSQRRCGSSVGHVIIAVVAAVVLVVVAAALVALFIRRRRRRSRLGNEAINTILNSRISPGKALKLCCTRIHSTTSVSNGGKSQPRPQVSVGVRTFTFKELSEATDQFSQIYFLGQGGFGSVYKGTIITAVGEVDVAIKQLQSGSVQGENEFVTEINVISRVHHRNLVSLVGYCVSGAERLLVYEYVENNNLAFHLRARVAPVLDWPTRLSIALGAAKGIAYLHEECHPGIIHRDIKSANILLDSNFRPKVADFGLAKFVPDDRTHVTTRVIGTFGYMAPEYGSSGKLTEKSDVFSFGTVLLELITGRSPINLVEWASPFLDKALEDDDFEAQLIDPDLETSYDHEQMNVMVTCAAVSVHRFPDHRPRMSQLVQVLEGNVSLEKLKAQTSRPRTRRQPT